MSRKPLVLQAVACAVGTLTGCKPTNMKMGRAKSKTAAMDAAAGGNNANASSQLEHCRAPLGTVSPVENKDAGGDTVLGNEYNCRPPPTCCVC